MNNETELESYLNTHLTVETIQPYLHLLGLIYKHQIKIDEEFTGQKGLHFTPIKDEWNEIVEIEGIPKEFDYAGFVLDALTDLSILRRISGGIDKDKAGFLYIIPKEIFKSVQETLSQKGLIDEKDIAKAETNINIFDPEELYSSVTETLNNKINVNGIGYKE